MTDRVAASAAEPTSLSVGGGIDAIVPDIGGRDAEQGKLVGDQLMQVESSKLAILPRKAIRTIVASDIIIQLEIPLAVLRVAGRMKE